VLKFPSGLRTWILPRSVADETALNPKGSSSGKFTKREWQVKSIEKRFPTYENNFSPDGAQRPQIRDRICYSCLSPEGGKRRCALRVELSRMELRCASALRGSAFALIVMVSSEFHLSVDITT
jgi:hypothetical protein